MNPEFSGPPDPHGDARIGQDMCRAVGAAEFDYAALVEGVHHRAGRIRRRRALTTGAIVAVFGPALLGGSALVLPDLLPSGVRGVVSADNTPDQTPVAALTDAPTDQPEPLSGERAATAAASEIATAADAPPWQESDPRLPAGGFDDSDSGDNAWQVPDARPTGVDYLEDFGAPRMGYDYRQVVPVSGPMACDNPLVRRGNDPEPLVGQAWAYRDREATRGLDIQITGWADGPGARDALRDDTMTYCFRDSDTAWERASWPDRDDDYLLYRAMSEGVRYDVAVVRQGDYLIGVSISGDDGGDGLTAAAEIASKTADNMQALDPVHGRD